MAPVLEFKANDEFKVTTEVTIAGARVHLFKGEEEGTHVGGTRVVVKDQATGGGRYG